MFFTPSHVLEALNGVITACRRRGRGREGRGGEGKGRRRGRGGGEGGVMGMQCNSSHFICGIAQDTHWLP